MGIMCNKENRERIGSKKEIRLTMGREQPKPMSAFCENWLKSYAFQKGKWLIPVVND